MAGLPVDRPGIRLRGLAALNAQVDKGSAAQAIAANALGPDCFPVRAILFDKNPAANWSLGWHQDRTVAVGQRHEAAGFGPWTVKSGLLHVAPPVSVLVSMVTLRIHLDPVPSTNAPLLIALGTHRMGLVAEASIDRTVAAAEIVACLAERGDIWLYRTLILHASAACDEPLRRLVLQIDYAAGPLPGGLEFLGI